MDNFSFRGVGHYRSVFIISVIVALNLNACSDLEASQSEVTATSYASNKSNPRDNGSGKNSPVPKATHRTDKVVESNLTGPQRNAARSASSYLSMMGFSRNGLIDQLSSDAGEGYSVADATAAVDSLDVDWNENAARSAKEYLDMTGFSCKRLIEQLSSSAGSKYTIEQATYGARSAGAC